MVTSNDSGTYDCCADQVRTNDHEGIDWLWQGFLVSEFYRELRLMSKLAGKRDRPTINSFVPRKLGDEELKNVSVPVLLLIGDHEVIYDRTRAIRRATALVPRLEAAVVPSANHSAQYSAPESVNSSSPPVSSSLGHTDLRRLVPTAA